MFELSDPIFTQSYFMIYEQNYSYMAQGIILSTVVFMFLLIAIGTLSRKVYHEVMGFIMVIETLGLMRIREYPIELNVYTILQGFSGY